MDDINLKNLCPLPWLHFSAHLDTTMRLCCNTDGAGFVLDNAGQTIKLAEVSSLSDYFNLEYYKGIRSKMMSGEIPKECTKCYEVEKHGGFSVRNGYLNMYQEDPLFKESVAKTDQVTGEISPLVRSLDFGVSNKCNLKCIMCSPSFSYILKGDFDKLDLFYEKEFSEGARTNWKNIKMLEKLLPEIAPTLREFLTTGGEPFLSEEHMNMLQIIIDTGHASNVSLNYHTNCTVKNEKLFSMWEKFKQVSVHFSIDAYGPVNEYIRFQTKWTQVLENVKIISSHPNTVCEVHSTIQALNLFNLPTLYSWIAELGLKDHLPFHIWMDHPRWLRMDVLPQEYIVEAHDKLLAFFSSFKLKSEQDVHRRDQILSYVKRSISSSQGPDEFKDFKKKIRQLEELRKTPPIESLIPELRRVFEI